MQPARLSSRTCLPIAVALIHTKKAPYKKLNLIERPPANPIGCITQREQNPAPHGGLFILVAAACVTKLSPQPYCTALSGTKGTSPHFCYVPACRKTFSCYQHVKDLFSALRPTPAYMASMQASLPWYLSTAACLMPMATSEYV